MPAAAAAAHDRVFVVGVYSPQTNIAFAMIYRHHKMEEWLLPKLRGGHGAIKTFMVAEHVGTVQGSSK